MENQANKLHELVGNNTTKKNSRTKFVAITSGKGGVGKSSQCQYGQYLSQQWLQSRPF